MYLRISFRPVGADKNNQHTWPRGHAATTSDDFQAIPNWIFWSHCPLYDLRVAWRCKCTAISRNPECTAGIYSIIALTWQWPDLDILWPHRVVNSCDWTEQPFLPPVTITPGIHCSSEPLGSWQCFFEACSCSRDVWKSGPNFHKFSQSEFNVWSTSEDTKKNHNQVASSFDDPPVLRLKRRSSWLG